MKNHGKQMNRSTAILKEVFGGPKGMQREEGKVEERDSKYENLGNSCCLESADPHKAEQTPTDWSARKAAAHRNDPSIGPLQRINTRGAIINHPRRCFLDVAAALSPGIRGEGLKCVSSSPQTMYKLLPGAKAASCTCSPLASPKRAFENIHVFITSRRKCQ